MTIRHYILGPLETNGYLIHNTREAIMIDPGGDPYEVIDYLKDKKLKLLMVLNTHLHFDHTYGNAKLFRECGALAHAHVEEELIKRDSANRPAFYNLPSVEDYRYETLVPGSYQWLGGVCQALHVPGHTPGSLAYYFPKLGAVFAGDVLFYRAVGRTDFTGGSTESLMSSIRDKLYALPPETVVYPGHGPETSIAEEMAHNPFIRG